MLVRKYFYEKASGMFDGISRWFVRVDRAVVVMCLVLIFVGWIAAVSISPSVAKKISAQEFSFIKKQTLFSVIGIFMMCVFSAISFGRIKLISFIMVGALLLLLSVMPIVSTPIKGSKRWISIFGFYLQPSEVLKPFFLVINGVLLRDVEKKKWMYFIKSLGLMFFVGTLLFLQPDFGMMIIYAFSWFLQLFLSNVSMWLIGFMLGGLGLVVVVAFTFLDHVRFRINAFLLKDGNSMPYQVKTSLASMSNGGLWGTGIGGGEIKKHLPDAHSDYIFAAIGEEVGWIATVVLMLIYVFLVVRSARFFMYEVDKEKRLVGMGIVGMLFIHIFASIGVSINLLPSKGTILPFISYGGSSMISFSVMLGILLSLTKKELRFTNLFEVLKIKGFRLYMDEHPK
jgi:cell division protein FtsW